MISVCSPGIPRTGTCSKSPASLSPAFTTRRPAALQWSHGSPTNGRALAIKQASPFSSTAEGASHGGVPAKVTGVRGSTGTKIVEVVDPISPAKLIDDQLPPLLSMIIDGLPPFQISKFVDEAEKHLHQYVERYQSVIFLDSYCRAGLSSASYGHSGVMSVDRLVAISINYALGFILDDIFFDTPNEFLHEQFGIGRGVCQSPEKIQEYLDHLDAVFSQQLQPSNPAPLIETMVWESGRNLLELSNPEWFGNFVACVVEHHRIGVASHADILQGHKLCFQDLESYSVMRAGNVGGKFIQLMIEFAKDTYIPGTLRASSYLEKVTMATSIHLGFVNDIFSYHKESKLEQNPRNLITVLMEYEEKPFVQTVHMAVDLVNTYARVIMDLEVEAWNSTLRNHLQEIKALIAGSIYYSSVEMRYRHPNSIFPELRDMTSDWKILPHAKGLEL